MLDPAKSTLAPPITLMNVVYAAAPPSSTFT